MNFQELWMCVKYPLAFSFVAIVSVFTFSRLRRGFKEAGKIQAAGKCTRYFDLKVTPPEGVTYKWCRLYRGGESYGGTVVLDEDRLKKIIGEGWYPVPYERHQDATETLDSRKLSIQLDGFILVQNKPLVEIEDKSDNLTRVLDGEVVSIKRIKAEILDPYLKEVAIDGEVLPPKQTQLDILREGCKQYWEECKEKNRTIDVIPEKTPDYKKMIEDGIERKEDNIEIEGVHDGMQFKLEIKSEGG